MRQITSAITIAALALTAAFTGCNSSSDIGASIVQDQVEVIIDSTFTLTGHTIDNNIVQSKTIAQLIGSIDAKGFGQLSSDVVTQFMPATMLDTVGIHENDIDSLKLLMQVNLGEFIGDSITPLGIDIYPLTRALPSPIYSNFDPQGYYDPAQKLGSTIYNVSAISQGDSVANLSYRTIAVRMPIDLGRRLFKAYREEPNTFAVPQQFVDQIFPGIYIKNSYGSGRVTRISASMMRMYYHRTFYDEETKKDSTIYKIGNYFAVTPEIVTNNNIHFTLAPALKAAIDAGQNIIVAPAGTAVEIKFPVLDIIRRYNANKGDVSVINTLSMSIPAQTIDNAYSIQPPQYLLMVLSKNKTTFFLDNNLPDSKTSFYAQYDTTTKTYNFSELRQYLIDMIAKGSDITEEDYTFTLVPVSAIFETSGSGSYYYNPSSVLSAIIPYVATPAMAKINLDKAKIKVTYSKQTISF